MDLTLKNSVKKLLKEKQTSLLKRLGQNFLVDKSAIKKIIDAAQLRPEDMVLEIGPGIGNLTEELTKRSKKVIAVEKDKKIAEILKEVLKDRKNVKIINADILEYDCPFEKFKVVANLPFYITSPIIRNFLESKVRPEKMILVVQKEVAQRICSKPPKMNLLALSVQFYAKPKIIFYISKKSFWPKPKVDSAIIEIIPKPSLVGDKDLFFRIAKAGFSHPRKQLINNLSEGLKINKEKTVKWLKNNQLKKTQRAETLILEDWKRLVETFTILE
ncbi:MAG: 16S rRNA (adenine(1518)-N(6)/adenine(1519)-N(6))-dimethyltransferase RsmA [Candidatus Nealsonbacteria bacterium]